MFGLMTAGVASAGSYTSGSWTLIAPQTNTYTAQVLQPINADGSSIFNHKSSTIPVQYKVTDTKSFAFESLAGATTVDTGQYSAASYTPTSPITTANLTSLSAVFAYTQGQSEGGSLRWSIDLANGKSIFVYYGTAPNWNGTSGSGDNLLADTTNLRFDTSQIGGTFYDTWANAQALSAGLQVTSVDLVVDSGAWMGNNQVINLTSATVTDNINGSSTFTMPASVTTQDNSAPAWIYLYKSSSATPAGQIDESLITSTQGDTGGQFRQVDSKYIYNLPVSNLPDPSATYQVGISFHSDGSNPAGVVQFGLK